jgi:hypothetical protein
MGSVRPAGWVCYRERWVEARVRARGGGVGRQRRAIRSRRLVGCEKIAPHIGRASVK